MSTTLEKLSDVISLFKRKFCAPILLSFRGYIPSLFYHIKYVLKLGPEEQVVGVAAASVVAFVEDVDSVGNRATIYLPSSPMSRSQSFAIPETAIPTGIFMRFPLPTISRVENVYMTPKSFLHGNSIVLNVKSGKLSPSY